MSPDEPSSDQSGVPLSPQPVQPTTPVSDASREAAAQIVRNQINNLYDGNSNNSQTAQGADQYAQTSPYDRTAATHPQPQIEDWKQYHSAWQNYYQKYYEGYYAQSLRQSRGSLNQQNASNNSGGYFANQPVEEEVSMTPDEAVFDLRQKLLGKVKDSAKKVRKSRHFVPITAALIVVLIFAFLQYNRVIISNVMAYVSPGNIDPQNIVIDPSTDVVVGPDPMLIIPKINVDVPVIYGVGSDYDSQMAAMVKGVAHFSIPGASSVPGQVGNTVLSGHSSNDLLDPGDYKFIFAQLDKLNVGDTIYANYKSKRYTYTVTKKEVVKPTDVNKLVYKTDKPMLTLITCTPLGTSTNRLLVTAEQVSPDPSAATKAPADSGEPAQATIPGNSPTFFERIFGGGQ